MRFQALGQVAVVREGEPIDLGAHKQRALFALLLINCNTVVSTDHILEALWADEGADRKSALQVYVSRLRSAIEPDRARGDASILRTQDPGYMLEVDPSTYDVAEFERLTSEARDLVDQSPAAASALFSEALDLWTGSAFEDFAYDEFTQAERDRLEDTRVWAIEERISADLVGGLSGELVSELEVLRERYPLRERLVGHQMLALYRAGRPADALRAIASFRRHIGDELGIDPSPTLLRLEEQILLHDERIQVSDRSPKLSLDRSTTSAVNPYKGLLSFEANDAPSFFGRDALIADLLRTVSSGERLIALVGASGSGKSSVIRAGLIPALAKGAIPGSDRWLIASMMPGAHPFAELEAALLRSTIDGPPSLSEQLQDPEAGILRSVLRILPDERSRLVLVIDQFEELFTMVESDAVRHRFLSNLITAIDDPRRRLTVVITLRADFYAQPLQHPKFGARLGNGIINVTQLSAEELEVAAVEPAKHAGVEFEPSLLGQLIADVGNQPGALPLFQYALTELFDRRSGDSLMSSTYRAMGAIDGALQRRADEVFEDLTDGEQDAARQLFLRLVSVSEHGQRSRRRVEAREIASLGVDTVTMQATIAKLGQNRLLSFDSDRLSGAPTVEVAHESLLTAWSMLESWIDESREDLRRHASLVVTLREWQLADENPEYLLSAARMAEFRGWEQTSNLRLNDAEHGYLQASETRLEAEKASRELERLSAAKGRRRLWSLVAVLGGSLAVAALFMAGVFATDPGPTITFFGQRNPDRASEAIKSGLDRAEADFDMVLEDVRWTVGFTVQFEDLARNDPEFVIPDTSLSFEPQLLLEQPDIRFGVVDPADDLLTTASNVSYVSFLNEEGGFLAGVAAASTTETKVVGFVGGQQIPLIEEFRAGFEAGVAAVDPDVEVLSTFIASSEGNGFRNPLAGDVRATALYTRGADVVFHAAGLSGQGIFTAADKYSAAEGTHVWGIGVDVDQWFDLTTNLQDHVLTSIIKRHDVAAYTLADHFITRGSGGLVAELGLADRGFDYATSGDALPAEAITTLDRFVEEISAGDITVPTEPTGSILVMDDLGGMVATLPAGTFAPDFEEFAAIAEGPHEVTSLGTPLTVDVVGDWFVQVNMIGHTVFSHPDSAGPGDRDVAFLRPTEFADPTNPGGLFEEQRLWPVSEMDGLDGFEEWLAVLPDGITSEGPRRTELAGKEAVYFEAEVGDTSTCGTSGYCVGFVVNTITPDGGISGWSFDLGIHQRVWVVDGGEHPPLVVIAATRSDDRSFQAVADDFLNRISIGAPGPHPLE